MTDSWSYLLYVVVAVLSKYGLKPKDDYDL